MSRHPDKDMLKSWKSFDTSCKLAKQAYETKKIARFRGLLSTLETCYYKFEEDYEFYKQDCIQKCGSLIAFNAVTSVDGFETPTYDKNDAWANTEMLKYVEVRDLLEDSILEENNSSPTNDISPSKGNVDFAVELYKSECAATITSITKLTAEIEAYNDKDMPPNIVTSFENLITKLHSKITVDIKSLVNNKLSLEDTATDSPFSHALIIKDYGQFVTVQTASLDTCSLLLTLSVLGY